MVDITRAYIIELDHLFRLSQNQLDAKLVTTELRRYKFYCTSSSLHENSEERKLNYTVYTN
jgi:hypothetical protein